MKSLLLLLVASTAYAERYPEDAWHPRVTVGAGIGLRSADVALVQTNGPNLAAIAEVKVKPSLFVGGTFDFSTGSTFEGPEISITTKSAQLVVRSLLMSFGDKPRELGGDMFVSAGVGREWNSWGGGTLARNVIALGAGTTLLLPQDTLDLQARFGLRLQFARAPEPGKRAPGCDGPCDTPTATEPYDLAMLLEVSCHVGR